MNPSLCSAVGRRAVRAAPLALAAVLCACATRQPVVAPPAGTPRVVERDLRAEAAPLPPGSMRVLPR
ncbi:hypothetical protein M8A51_22995 [Schlegelella sp. S2-27]|uniref:Uncharacterized protein n=1 Tax=Caldimonas mangrovi TaxID=2944811 RepID=A0ABT0YUI0_9BURK|nr:hypothetical protein [Caldimonas mangrovi]MCM5682405.1 hypothetical protein [Caldimonas mangrovi]